MRRGSCGHRLSQSPPRPRLRPTRHAFHARLACCPITVSDRPLSATSGRRSERPSQPRPPTGSVLRGVLAQRRGDPSAEACRRRVQHELSTPRVERNPAPAAGAAASRGTHFGSGRSSVAKSRPPRRCGPLSTRAARANDNEGSKHGHVRSRSNDGRRCLDRSTRPLARAGFADRGRGRRTAHAGDGAHQYLDEHRPPRRRRPARPARRGRGRASGRHDRPAARPLRIGPHPPVARAPSARRCAAKRDRPPEPRERGAWRARQAVAQARRGARRCRAALQPAQQPGRLGPRERAHAGRLHDRPPALARACAARLPLHAPAGRRAGRRPERHRSAGPRFADLAAPGANRLDDGPRRRTQGRGPV